MTGDVAVGDIRVERVGALPHIGRSSWDALCGAGAFYLCHDWLSYVEHEAGVDADYLIAADGAPLTIVVPKNERELDPILLTIPLQLLAYHAALVLGHDIDKPRNLAKSVTVE